MPLTPTDLPPHLAERTRPANTRIVPTSGELVLYWMHHGVRAYDNPALDTALEAAARLDLPLLVYQGLGGNHPYDSDRHHAFILEGARDVAAALASRNVRHVFHLHRKGHAGSPLTALARKAALVVTEDFPAPPFPAWTRALSSRISAPIWQVDTACVLPMQRIDRAYARAFEFRRDHGEALLQRARAPWPETRATAAPYSARLGFQPVALATADLSALCATCAIDHSVAPVPDTRGGSRAAQARWARFAEHGLAHYDRLRNDAAIAPPRGVSRISAYLHHGHLSPFQVAREASAHGSSGAEKYLDELLIWRELSHNVCFHTALDSADPGDLCRLPDWARKTLSAHALDRRPATLTWEQLSRGTSGDALWDAAQRSLLIHGELHNNLRMTWGKAFLNWTRTPQEALRWMIDLNHRYALDGSDPNSYGGLLYCLGLFDRPFSPEQPVFGQIRTRPTAQHAKRLDLPAYSARTGVRSSKRVEQVAVIGAGLAGLTAARTLHDQGIAASVFERGRGVAGRMAHRRADTYRFDHGAQYFTVKDLRFQRYVDAWVDAGLVAPWQARIASRCEHGTLDAVSPLTRYVGVPGMNAIARHLSDGLDITKQCTIVAVQRNADSWQLTTESGETHGPYDALIMAMPPPQLKRLIDMQAWHIDEDRVAMTPCWCAMVAFDAPLAVDVDGLFANDDVIDWVARDSSKPGRPAGERWVIHASEQWSAGRLEGSPDSCARELTRRFFEILDLAPVDPAYLAGHRWSFARPSPTTPADSTANTECIWHGPQSLALCGDWCGGGRVEGAFLSGTAAAARVTAHLTSTGSGATYKEQSKLLLIT